MKKSRVIPVRTAEEEHALIRRAAVLTGRSVSGYIRNAAVISATRDTRSHPAIEAARQRVQEEANKD